MKKDASRILHDRYFKLNDRTLEIRLRNGKRIRGFIIGFVAWDADDEKSPIRHWHILEEKDLNRHVSAVTGLDHGTMIRHRDISSVLSMEDQRMIYP